MDDRNLYKVEGASGGQADGSKRGYPDSFADSNNIDIRTDIDSISLNRRLVKESGSVVVDLIKDYAFIPYNDRPVGYMHGDTGKLYERKWSGSAYVYTDLATIPNSHGQGLSFFRPLGQDCLLVTSDSGLHKFNYDSSTGSLAITTPSYDFFKTAKDNVVAYAYAGAGGNNYAVPASISEASTSKKTFTAAGSSLKDIAIWLTSYGAQDVTITLHDGSNNVLGTSTVTSGNLSNICRFVFTTPIQLTIGTSYHFHITATSAPGVAVSAATTNDLSTVGYGAHYIMPLYDVDQKNDLTAQSGLNTKSFSVGTTINEASTAKISFTPTKNILGGIGLCFYTSGTGTLTVTIHDSKNTVVASQSYNLATYTGTDFGPTFRFDFTTPVRLKVDNQYHIHLTATSTCNVLCSTNGDLSTAGFFTFFQVVNPDSDFHPTLVSGNKFLYGHGNMVGSIDDSMVLNPENLVLPYDEKVRCIQEYGDSVIVTTWKGTSIDNFGWGKAYLWNPAFTDYDASIPIDGQINAICPTPDNMLATIWGTQLHLSYFTGAFTPMWRAKPEQLGRNSTIEVLPKGITTWEGLVVFAPYRGNSTTYDRVVHCYGRQTKDTPLVMSKDFTISTGNKNSNVNIGAVMGVNPSTLLVAWKDSNSGTLYGVDCIDTTTDAASGYITHNRFDANRPNQQENAVTVSATFKPLTSTQKYQIWYRRDYRDEVARAGETVSGGYKLLGEVDGSVSTNTGKMYKSFKMTQKDRQFFSIQWKEVLINNGGTTGPTRLAFEASFDKNPQMQKNRK